MKTLEVKREGWGTLCDRINEAARGALVSIEVVRDDGQAAPVAADLPFDSVSLQDQGVRCSDNLVVKLGANNVKNLQHLIVEPIHIRLKNGDNDRYNRVHILAESGTTILTFRPGFGADMLNGLD